MMTKQLQQLFGVLLIAPLVGLPALAHAQFEHCRPIANDAERLACYDKAVAPNLSGLAAPAAAATVADSTQPVVAPPAVEAPSPGHSKPQRGKQATLSERWELDAEHKRGTFAITPYKPVYILPVTHTDNINQTPSSSAQGHTVSTAIGSKATEAQFQLSLKTKAAENLFGDNGDLWFGYTQQSRWQVYNATNSRPFRETNYEPEAMLVFRTNYELLGFKGKMAGLALNHQSNGQADPLSRSWNRIIGQAGFERDDWIALVRGWWRVPEKTESDDNPGIENYSGRADLTLIRKLQGHTFTTQLRHSLRSGENAHGSAQFNWSFPISNGLKGYAQVFSGYGESLIDFNHRQTVVGIGFSVLDWF